MVDSPSPHEAFATAVRIAGGQSAAARLVGVTQGAIWQRLDRRKPASEKWALILAEATGIPKEQLRPDIYPPQRGITHTDSPAPGTRHHFATAPEPIR